MKISAREANYGTRVDYILVTPGMLPWIKHGDIQPSLKGSDHCPIYIDLHDEITTDTGERLFLRDVLPMGGGEPPRLAAQRWDEYSGKQTLLSTFFGKGKEVNTADGSPFSSVLPTPDSQLPIVQPVVADPNHSQPAVDLPPPAHPSLKSTCISTSQPFAPSPKPQPNLISSSQAALSSSSAKRKATSDSGAKKALKKLKGGQSKLSAFFAQPSATSPYSQRETDSPGQDSDQKDYMDSDYQLALELSASLENPDSRCSLASAKPSASQSKTAWSQLMAPIQPPNCIIHGEPGKEYTVNKPGPNKGKTFFLCSRFVYFDHRSSPFISRSI